VTKPKPKIKPSSATWVVNDILTTWRYYCEDNPAIPALWVKGSVPLFLVLGENAGGKSFFRRCVYQCVKLDTRSTITEVIHLSMQGRTGDTGAGPYKSFIYGDEETRSTGENSASTIRGALRTCHGRENDHFLYWDEPDIGMSEGAAAGAGITIADFVTSLPEHTKGVFITTHSRALVERLLPVQPHYIHLGCAPDQAPQTLQAWLERPIVPISPEELAEASRERFGAIQKILNERRKPG
jgi:hypothetical protein